MPKGGIKMERPTRLPVAEQVEQWWKLLLEMIATQKPGVLPHVALIPCRLLATNKKPLRADTPLVPSLIVRGKVPYDRIKNMASVDHALVKAFIKRVKAEIEKFDKKNDLAAALKTRQVKKIRLELIDTGKKRGGGLSSSAAPHILAERLVA